MRTTAATARDFRPSFRIRTLLVCVALSTGHLALARESAQPQRKGELHLTGQFIKKLVLERYGEENPISLEFPGPTVLLPEGRYRWVEVTLGSREKDAPSFSAYAYGSQWINVTESRPATLRIGGPLKPELFADRNGDKITMSHRLSDAAGHSYSPASSARLPRFTVFRDGQPIATGQFEYG